MLSRQDDAFFPRWYLCTIEQRELLSLQSQISGKLFVVIQLLLEDRCQWLPRAVRTKPHPYSTTKIRPSQYKYFWKKKSLAFSKGFLICFSKKKLAYTAYTYNFTKTHTGAKTHFLSRNSLDSDISKMWILR